MHWWACRKFQRRPQGTVKLSSLGRLKITLTRSSSHDSSPADVDPQLKRTLPCSSIFAGGDVVAMEKEKLLI